VLTHNDNYSSTAPLRGQLKEIYCFILTYITDLKGKYTTF